MDSTGTHACTDDGRRCTEALFFDNNRQSILRLEAARFLNTYGPPMVIKDDRGH